MSTLAEVARRAGVGAGTASRALTGRGAVDPATRARVLQAAAALGYHGNAAARALRERRSRTIGLVVPDIVNEFYTASAAVVQSELRASGFDLLLATTSSDPELERRALADLVARQVEGVVQVPVDPAAPRAPLPVVHLNRTTDAGGVPAVLADDKGGVAELTRAVLGAGHRDLVVVVGPLGLSTSRERLAGFRSAVEAFSSGTGGGGAVRSREVVTEYTADGGRAALAGLRHDLPSAVVALSSRLVLGVLQGAQDAGLVVPRDLSVAGLGDPDWYSVWPGGITTYVPPLREMGRVAARLLLAQLPPVDGGPGGSAAPVTDATTSTAAPEVLHLSGHLAVRGSVGGMG